ncbi:MAG: GNAT family N-acetyltransferase [Acidobacteria bacterium]|nr:GNAT family N-acetyltransferase [Acidobacteriota bacterium]
MSPNAKELEIRLLKASDVAEAMRLKTAAGWNQTEEDWLRLLSLCPDGCFAATAGARLVGTTTTTVYGRELAWVGMVLVDPGFRRRGIATALVRAALEGLDAAAVATVKLDATPEGAPVYEALGFEAELRIERWVGAARAEASPAHAAEGAPDPTQIFELDRRAFGADRSELLRALLEESFVTSAVSMGADGRLRGYALARRGAMAGYVGPLVAEEAETAAALLDDVLNRLGAGRVCVDLNTTYAGGARVLEARGFVKQRELIRMQRGGGSGAGTSDSVFAIAGPEVG